MYNILFEYKNLSRLIYLNALVHKIIKFNN